MQVDLIVDPSFRNELNGWSRKSWIKELKEKLAVFSLLRKPIMKFV